jgi:hypothetical protein
LKRLDLGMTVVMLAGGLAFPVTGCGKSGKGTLTPAEELDAALRPTALAAAMRRLSGAHFTGTARYRITPGGARKPGDEAAADAITTTTELSLDRAGQFRLVESNDQDGGREVVLHGRELAVAIRPGKMIRRSAQEPEPTRLLEEAVGGPWASWETVRRFAAVERTAPGVFRLARSASALSVAAGFAESTPLRRWRDSVSVQALEGEVKLDPKTGALLAFALKAQFTATREDRVPLAGEVAVNTRLDGIGTTAAIAAPAAEVLSQRQRTILEERALLGAANKEAR